MNLTGGLHYRTELDTSKQVWACPVDLQKLADILPHGSGIDGNWRIEVLKTGDVRVHGEYHAMNEQGYYCGWRNFRFTLRQCKRNEYKALSGPCAGQFQVLRIKGHVYLDSFVGGGDAKDYLYDAVSIPLSDEMGIRAIEGGITVNSEQAAKSYRA